MNTIKQELKRCTRTIKGLEFSEAKARSHRLTMAQMGVSSTNLVFDSSLASDCLDPEIIKILKDDPTHDHNLMYEQCPKGNLAWAPDGQISIITSSSRSGHAVDQVEHEGIQIQGIELDDLQTLDQLHKPRSATQAVISQLPFFIHDLERWKHGFNPVKYKRAMHQLRKAALTAVHGAERINRKGEVITRKLRIKRRVPRVQAQSMRY